MEKKRKNTASLEAEDNAPKKQLDPSAKEALKQFEETSQYQTKRENLLLGEFSADGKYSLTDGDFMQDLVSMPKVLQERDGNVVRAYTKFKGINLNFKVELDISESYCSAEIFLVEIEHQPDEDIKHLTSLGNFVEMYSPSFKDNVYKAWNINLQETPLDKDDVVFKTLKELEGERNFSKELVEILSQLYVVRMLKLLDNCGTLGLKIQGDYRALVEELLRKDPSLAQDHTRLKQLLDRMIAKHNGFDFLLRMPGGADILRNYAEPVGRVLGHDIPVLVEPVKIEQPKPKTADDSASKKDAQKKKKAKGKGGDTVKPFVYSIKDYKPAVLTTPEEVKKILPTQPTAVPLGTNNQTKSPEPALVEKTDEQNPPKVQMSSGDKSVKAAIEKIEELEGGIPPLNRSKLQEKIPPIKQDAPTENNPDLDEGKPNPETTPAPGRTAGGDGKPPLGRLGS